jgi:hypothetical protein
MKHIQKISKYLKNDGKINEAVRKVGENYQVTVVVDVPQKLITAYSKKVLTNVNKNLSDIYGSEMIAEELVRYVLKEYLDAEKIDPKALTGGDATPNNPGVKVEQPAGATPPAPAATPATETPDNFEEVKVNTEELPE